MPLSERPALPPPCGFTLVELLVVFSILALVVTIVPPALQRLHQGMAWRSTVQDVAAQLRAARHMATVQGRAVTFALHPQNREYAVLGRKPTLLPESVGVQLVTAQEAELPDGSQAIVFLPEGGSTGGSISLLRAGREDSGIRLRVDWLSGQITREALDITP